MANSADLDPILPWPAVQPLVGNIDRTTWWRAIRRGEAPESVKITANRVGWRASDIRHWLASRAPTSQAA